MKITGVFLSDIRYDAGHPAFAASSYPVAHPFFLPWEQLLVASIFTFPISLTLGQEPSVGGSKLWKWRAQHYCFLLPLSSLVTATRYRDTCPWQSLRDQQRGKQNLRAPELRLLWLWALGVMGGWGRDSGCCQHSGSCCWAGPWGPLRSNTGRTKYQIIVGLAQPDGSFSPLPFCPIPLGFNMLYVDSDLLLIL